MEKRNLVRKENRKSVRREREKGTDREKNIKIYNLNAEVIVT